MTFVADFAAGILFSSLFLKYLSFPYLWISICWSLVFALLTWSSPDSRRKYIWFNLGFVAFTCGGLEVYSYFSLASVTKQTRSEGGYVRGYFTPNEILGYGPAPSKSVRSRKYHNNQLIYDVSYTIDSRGLRISPPSRTDRCILFFGDSFTFGEGVMDHEAMPYVVGELSKYKILNYGFPGYGPHQMLSAIEHGMLDRTVDCKPAYAIYQAYVDVARAAGYDSWDKHGPKYVVSDEGLKYDGHFDDVKAVGYREKLRGKLEAQVEKSYVYKRYFENRSRIRDQDVDRFVEIVDTSRRKLVERYPGLQFHVILWPADRMDSTYKKTYEVARARLHDRGINLHYVTDILPDWSTNMSRYILSDYDQHPNAFAHAQIAQYVLKNILSTKVGNQA